MRAVVDTSAWVRFVAVTGELAVCRDPDDDKVIETAIGSGADVLVTEDKDLLEDPRVLAALSAVHVRVLTVAQFMVELENPEE